MTVSTIPPVTPLLKFFDSNGAPLAFGQLFTYQTGTSTKQATYVDSTGNTPNTNPIILNARGECSVWLDSSLVYKLVLAPSTDSDPPSSPIWTQDPIGSFNITQTTGNFTTITVSAQGQIAYLNMTGNTLPANGLYLPALNRLGFTTNTKARGYIDAGGIWTLLAPDASGPTITIAALGSNNTNTLQLTTAGSMINMARSSDGGLSNFVGSRAGTANISLYNAGGVTAEAEVGVNTVFFYTNAALRGGVNSSNQWQFYEPTYSIGAAGLYLVATLETGSFTGTLTGCTTSPTTSVFWRRSGTLVTLNMDANLTATSNSVACTITGMPAALQPVKAQRFGAMIEDNTVALAGFLNITAASNIINLIRPDGAAFTAAGTKGAFSFTVTYSLV